MLTRRKIDHKAINLIQDDLSHINWEQDLQNLDCEDSFNLFHDQLLTSLDNHGPEHSFTRRGKKSVQPWVTSSIKQCIRKQKKLYKEQTLNPSDISSQRYRDYRSCLQRLIRNCKRQYYSDLCIKHKSNTKRLWSIINEILEKERNKSNVVDCLTIDGIKTYDSS